MKWPLYIIGSSVGILIVVGLNIKFHGGWLVVSAMQSLLPLTPDLMNMLKSFGELKGDSACRDREMADTSMSNEAYAESLDSGCA